MMVAVADVAEPTAVMVIRLPPIVHCVPACPATKTSLSEPLAAVMVRPLPLVCDAASVVARSRWYLYCGALSKE